MSSLGLQRLEPVDGWGRALRSAGYVWRPSGVEGIQAVLETARKAEVPIVARGAGRSYGDAALHPESIVLELGRMNRILDWDPATGRIEVEPGLTIEGLWRACLGDGWWPAVVPGTMRPTIGGCLGMNIHGKNNWARGTFAEHCEGFELLDAKGEKRWVESGDALFHDVAGGFGQLGVITRARLQLKRVESGLVEVEGRSCDDLGSMLALLDESKESWEYLVGWIDAFATGKSIGRGILHFARHLDADEDPSFTQSLRLQAQDLPEQFFGVVPKSMLWMGLKAFLHNPGMRMVNLAKYRLGKRSDGHRLRQSLSGYSFLLDYVPGWQRAYDPHGLIQHQSFLPAQTAERAFCAQLKACQKAGMPSYLAVIKRHRPDPFTMSHGVDGYSLALDFAVGDQRNRRALWALVRQLAEIAVEAGGRFYAAKDAAIPAELYQRSLGSETIERFLARKAELDPNWRFRSALADRLGLGPGD